MVITIKNKLLSFLIFLVIQYLSQAQDCLALLLEYKYDIALECLDSKNFDETNNAINLSRILLTNGEIQDSLLQGKNNSIKAKTLDSLSQGYITLYNNSKDIKESFRLFKSALEMSRNAKDITLQKMSLLAILNSYNYALVQSNEESEYYLEEFKKLIDTPADEFQYLINTIIYGLRNIQWETNVPIENVERLEVLMENFSEDHPFWPYFFSITGTYYEDEHSNQNEKAYQYYQNVISKDRDVPKYLRRIYFRTYIRLGEISKLNKSYDEAIKYIDKAANYINPKDSLRSLYYLKNYVSEYHYLNGDYDKAYRALKRSKRLSDSLLYEQNALEISDLNVRYQTAEKEKENLILQEEKTKNRNIALALGSLLLFGGMTFSLIQKNTKRKQLLAEQEKELQAQKLTSVLKEQELQAIDAMIEGQEKERQRIANDLHDDLGGLMATVKLHVKALEKNNAPHLFKTTNKLIEEAYDKIRTVAHVKNSGLIGSQGLVTAVKQLQINVIEHGLDQRFENSIELTLFRIIQELLTNIIKHAEATEVDLHLTHHDKILNIMIEDNGKGFTPEVNQNGFAGIGLSSIEKRVAFLKGSFTIESEINHGTTAILDIPL